MVPRTDTVGVTPAAGREWGFGDVPDSILVLSFWGLFSLLCKWFEARGGGVWGIFEVNVVAWW